LRWQSSARTWFDALAAGLRRIVDYAPDYVVVSLGVDTYIHDPISQFRLESDDYLSVGAQIAGLGVPTLFVMEGGYAVADIGVNTTNVLIGASELQTR
jgi:acetoin utilization deacetylase AcuC-like enzyme